MAEEGRIGEDPMDCCIQGGERWIGGVAPRPAAWLVADLEVPAQAGFLKGPVPVWTHGAPWRLCGWLWRNIWMERSSGQWHMDVGFRVEIWVRPGVR